MLVNNNYLKNYLLVCEKKIFYKENFFFIINFLVNIEIDFVKNKIYFLLINKFKLSKFFIKGDNYYFFVNKKEFLKCLYNFYQLMQLNYLNLNNMIYKNNYLNLNNNNLSLFFDKIGKINLDIYIYIFNILYNILLNLIIFLVKLIKLLKIKC